LASVGLFKDLDHKELARLERLAHRRTFPADHPIVREGEGGIALFVIIQGKARVTQTTPQGQTREMRVLGPGDVFGELALFGDRPRSATITTIEPCECLALHRLEFLEELRRNPEIAIRLLDTLAQRLSEAEHRE
jgi:CRP-like cAMP-binding protein